MTDSLNFLDAVAGLPEQLTVAHESAAIVHADALPKADSIRNIVVLGMGGSGISGDVVAAAFNDEVSVPISVLKQIRSPAFVGEELVVSGRILERYINRDRVYLHYQIEVHTEGAPRAQWYPSQVASPGRATLSRTGRTARMRLSGSSTGGRPPLGLRPLGARMTALRLPSWRISATRPSCLRPPSTSMATRVR